MLVNLVYVLHSPSSILDSDMSRSPEQMATGIDVGIITSISRHYPVPQCGQLPFNRSTPIWSAIFIVLKISGIVVMCNCTLNMPVVHLILM